MAQDFAHLKMGEDGVALNIIAHIVRAIFLDCAGTDGLFRFFVFKAFYLFQNHNIDVNCGGLKDLVPCKIYDLNGICGFKEEIAQRAFP